MYRPPGPCTACFAPRRSPAHESPALNRTEPNRTEPPPHTERGGGPSVRVRSRGGPPGPGMGSGAAAAWLRLPGRRRFSPRPSAPLCCPPRARPLLRRRFVFLVAVAVLVLPARASVQPSAFPPPFFSPLRRSAEGRAAGRAGRAPPALAVVFRSHRCAATVRVPGLWCSVLGCRGSSGGNKGFMVSFLICHKL